MRINEILPEAYVGQASTIGSIKTGPIKKIKAKKRVEELVNEGPIWDKVKKAGAIGATAAALAGGAGPTTAAPYQHSQKVDQMSGEKQGTESTVASDNSDATLIFRWNKKEAIIRIPGATMNYGLYGLEGRIKLPGASVEPIFLAKSSTGNYNVGFISGKNNLTARLLASAGKVKIEVPIYNKGNMVYEFTLEPDATAKAGVQQVSQFDKSQAVATKQSASRAALLDAAENEYTNLSEVIEKNLIAKLKEMNYAPQFLAHTPHMRITVDTNSNVIDVQEETKGYVFKSDQPLLLAPELYQGVIPKLSPTLLKAIGKNKITFAIQVLSDHSVNAFMIDDKGLPDGEAYSRLLSMRH